MGSALVLSAEGRRGAGRIDPPLLEEGRDRVLVSPEVDSPVQPYAGLIRLTRP